MPGVWGTYFSAMVPGLWLNEGGQSAAGAAIDHLVQMRRDSGFGEGREDGPCAGGIGLSQWLSQEAERRGGALAAARLIGDVARGLPSSSATVLLSPIPTRAA